MGSTTIGHRYLLSNRTLCSRAKIVIGVVGTAAAADNRQTIRSTWALWAPDDVKVLFVVGRGGASMQEEMRRHGDLLQVDMDEHWRHRPLKTLHLLRFVNEHCPKATHVVKTIDKVFLNLPLLVQTIRRDLKVSDATMRGAASRGGPYRGGGGGAPQILRISEF